MKKIHLGWGKLEKLPLNADMFIPFKLNGKQKQYYCHHHSLSLFLPLPSMYLQNDLRRGNAVLSCQSCPCRKWNILPLWGHLKPPSITRSPCCCVPSSELPISAFVAPESAVTPSVCYWAPPCSCSAEPLILLLWCEHLQCKVGYMRSGYTTRL